MWTLKCTTAGCNIRPGSRPLSFQTHIRTWALKYTTAGQNIWPKPRPHLSKFTPECRHWNALRLG